VLSVRVSPETKRELDYFARKYQRKLSREVEDRLKFTFGRYGRPTHIADLADLVALLAQSVERKTRGQWDRHSATRESLIRAFTRLVDVYSKADVTSSSISVPGSEADFERGRDDPATKAVNDVILSLLHSVHLGQAPEIYGLGVGVISKIQRNLERRSERRRRKK
jgi:predicted DNA-binding protein